MPVFVSKACDNQSIPVYGDGQHVRQWLHVSDHCDALIELLKEGKLGNKVERVRFFTLLEIKKQQMKNWQRKYFVFWGDLIA